MSLHKLTAGDGYLYLIRQVAAQDATERGRGSLESYYSAKGESPGEWWGAGLNSLGVSGVVTEAQMKALFGEGVHPDADEIMGRVIAGLPAGTNKKDRTKAIDNAIRLGRKFSIRAETSDWKTRLTDSYVNWQLANPGNKTVPESVRQQLRTELANEMFAEINGRVPANEQELSGFVAQQSKAQTAAVAGFDLTFSPVKSVSTLWAVAPIDTARKIEAAHDAAVERTMTWLQTEAGYTREGARGVAQVEAVGLVAAVFKHRDSRAGDPDIHTHVAVSNKVQAAESGKWLALDGRMIHRLAVAASEMYNTVLEQEITQRVGGRFEARADGVPGRRPVRELVGVIGKLNSVWSSRRRMIDAELSRLQSQFVADHGRTPTAIERVALAQEANLSTRQAKHEPRSLEQQRQQWATEAAATLGSPGAVEQMVQAAIQTTQAPDYLPVDRVLIGELAAEVVRVVAETRAQWREHNLHAEALRQARYSDIDPAEYETVAARVTAQAASLEHCIPIGMDSDLDVPEPDELTRSTGESKFRMVGNQLYTSPAILAAEHRILAAAAAVGGPVVTAMDVEVAALEWSANNDGRTLNTSQALMVKELATNSRRVQLAMAPAGTGKTTVMGVLAAAAQSTGMNVIGLAPTAAAAQELSAAIEGVQGDTLDKLVYDLSGGPGADPDRWYREIGRHSIVIVDEAGIASTPKLDAAIRFVVAQGGRVVLVGDDQQRAAGGAGGILRNIEAEHGALTLTEVMRFTDPQVAAASLALRTGDNSVTGFYTDRGYLHAATSGTVVDQVYDAWQADVDAGADSIMIAPTWDLVAELNAKVRAHKLATGQLTGASIEIPRTGELVSAGDTIVTKKNKRTLSLGSTDFVRNNYRWNVEEVRADGSLRVRLLGRNLVRTLPAWYVAEGMVRLGYAYTEASVQGMTVGSRGRRRGTAHVILTEGKTRNDLYVNMTRATDGTHVHIVTPGTGDAHDVVTPGAVLPPTAVEIFNATVSRDGTPLSVTTQIEQAGDPALRLGPVTDAYTHSILAGAGALLGAERMRQLEAAAVQILPGLRHAPAWDTLHAHLAMIELQGGQAIDRLQKAIDVRELDTARDIAAVLDWRMDRTGNHSQDPGPLAWIPAVPAALAEHAEWGPYLRASAERVAAFASQVRESAAAWTVETSPVWAQPYVLANPGLVVDLAVWRAAQSVPDTDRRPAGEKPRTIAHGVLHQELTRRAVAAVGDPAHGAGRWGAMLEAHSPALAAIVTRDESWPELARRLSRADAAGLPVARLVDQAVNDRAPLPAEGAAGALMWRLTEHLGSLTAAPTGGHQLRPQWVTNLQGVLGHDATEKLIGDRMWTAVVGRMDAYARTEPATVDTTAPAVMLETAARMLHTQLATVPAQERATVLLWNLTTLTDPEPFDDEHPVPDPEQHDLQAPADAWDLLNEHLARATDPSVQAPDLVGPGDSTDPFDPERFAPPADLSEVPPLDLDDFDLDPVDAPIDPYDLEWNPDPADLAALPAPELQPAAVVEPIEPADPELQPADPETAPVPALAEAEHQAALARARAAIADAHAWWRTLTPQSWVPAYIAGRGLDPADFAFAPPGWTRTFQHLTALGYTEPELLAAGLIRINSKGRVNDVFHGRAILPLTNPDGIVAGFIGRKAPTDVDDRNPKYVNSPTTELYKKSSNLYGLNPDTVAAIRAGAPVVIVEGPMDAAAITTAAAGAAVAVATNGTALTMDHMRVLQSAGALGRGHSLTLAFDGDRAGRAATNSAHALLTDLDINDAQAIVWQAGKDASQLLEDHGPQAVRDALNSAQPLAAAVVRNHIAAAGTDLDQTAQRALLATVAPAVAQLDRQYRGAMVSELDQSLRERAVDGQTLDAFAVHDEVTKHLPIAPVPTTGPDTGGGLGLPALPTRPGAMLTVADTATQQTTATASAPVIDQEQPAARQEPAPEPAVADALVAAEDLSVVEQPAAVVVDQEQPVDLQEEVSDLQAFTEDLAVVELPAAVGELVAEDLSVVEQPAAAVVDEEQSVDLQEDVSDLQAFTEDLAVVDELAAVQDVAVVEQPPVAVVDQVGDPQQQVKDLAVADEAPRPHQQTPDAALTERIAQQTYDLAQVTAQLQAAARHADDLGAAVLSGRGPAQVAVEQGLALHQQRLDAAAQMRELQTAARSERAQAISTAERLGQAQDDLSGLGRFAGRRREDLTTQVAQLTQERDTHRARMLEHATAATNLQTQAGSPQQQQESAQVLQDRAAYEAGAAQQDAAAADAAHRAAAELRQQESALREQLQELQREQQLRREQPDQQADTARQQAHVQRLAEQAAEQAAAEAAATQHQVTPDDDDLEIPGQDEWNQQLVDQELGYDTPDLYGDASPNDFER
ncbi:MobF family relaxase [Variovorax sp. PBS-H4]|uniref:MobF family relaxase n=1 Tax=Variovorax sp. PBS-H4 TaxID=434008 RepID=UPI0013A537DA|nr:MobF family relaxase [Variovorax sp. PBS-H4]